VGAISVPVFGPAPGSLTPDGSRVGREVVAVVTLVDFSSRLSPKKIAEFVPRLVEAARDISDQLGASLDY
jgi:hypothetical protein